jgi:hypothetical protein
MTYVKFKTSGRVDQITDDEGNVIGYYIGRKDSGRIRLSRVIAEMFDSDNSIMIDPWGSIWVKK